jgi:hypothetical protein
MASLMLKETPKHVGENAHIDHGWSYNMDEKIVQFFFQLVRCKNHKQLKVQINDILQSFRGRELGCIPQMTVMYKLIGQTRDIVAGKGEQQLAFMQLWAWYQYYPVLAIFALDQFVFLNSSNSAHPYGSWKDIKYWCEYVKNQTGSENHALITAALEIAEKQLLYDDCLLSQRNQEEFPHISLVGKWFPREKSKYGWLFKKMALRMFGNFIDTASTQEKRQKAKIKGRIMLKKMLTALNKYLDTPQIKMCAGEWENLHFSGLTTQTLRRQKLALLNKNKKGEVRAHMNKRKAKDRIKCAEKFTVHIEAAKVDPKRHKVHGKRCNAYELVKDGFAAINSVEIDTVNLQWESNKSNNKGLEKTPFIAMVDTSSSMTCDNNVPLYNAIGLGIRVSELTHPSFRHRVLTFDAAPNWVNMEDCSTFVEKIHKVRDSSWGMNTNFYAALTLILDVILANNIPPREVEGLVLAVFSDMQLDHKWSGTSGSLNTMSDNIRKMYYDAGMKSSFKVPYEAPHILFWNLRATDGFPALSTEKNVTMLSGYNSTLLNVFCNKGINALKGVTPRKIVADLLDNPRYVALEEKIVSYFA